MSTSPRLQLLAFGPSWGAPSLDAASTKAHAWLLFCGLKPGIDFAVEPCANPHVGLTGELPVLQVNSEAANGVPSLAEPHEIFSKLAALGHDPNVTLTAAQRAKKG